MCVIAHGSTCASEATLAGHLKTYRTSALIRSATGLYAMSENSSMLQAPSVYLNYLNTGTKLLTGAACDCLLLRLSECKPAECIHERTALLDSTRHTGVAGRNIEAGVAREEVARPEKQCHRLCGHDGEIFRTGKVRDAKGVP
jgi:hypothetical protein